MDHSVEPGEMSQYRRGECGSMFPLKREQARHEHDSGRLVVYSLQTI